MTKLKILFAALSVIASAGLVNCSELKSNKHLPDGGEQLPVVTPKKIEGETPEEKEARLIREKMDFRISLNEDLKRMSEAKYDSSKCLPGDEKVISEKTVVTEFAGQETESTAPVARIKNKDLNVSAVKIAATTLAKDMNSAENSYCAVNVGADIAKYALENFILDGSYALDNIDPAEYDLLVEKAAYIVKEIKPVMDKLIYNNSVAERDKNLAENMRTHSLLRKVIEIRKQENIAQFHVMYKMYSQCEANDNCSRAQRVMKHANAYTYTAIKEANQTLDDSQLSGENDPQIIEKNIRLSSAYQELNKRLRLGTQFIEMRKGEIAETETAADSAPAVDIHENPAVAAMYAQEDAAAEHAIAEKLNQCIERVKKSCLDNLTNDQIDFAAVIACEENSDCPAQEKHDILNGNENND